MTTTRPALVPLLVIGALLFLMPLAHASGLSDPFGLPRSALLSAGALALLAHASVCAFSGGAATRLRPVPKILGGLFIVAAGTAAVASANRGLALRGLADLAALVVIAWGAAGVARDPARVLIFFRVSLASATLIAAGTLAQILRPGFHVAWAGFSLLPPAPGGATFGDPGLAAQWLVVSLPFCVAAVAAARGVTRLLAGAALGLVTAALLLIGRPEGWFAAAIVAAGILATRMIRAFRSGDGWRELTPAINGSGLRTAVVVVVVALIVVAITRLPGLSSPAAPLARVSLLAPTSGDPAVDRVAGVRGSLALVGLHPLGVGPSYFRHAFLEVAWTRIAPSPFSLTHQAVHAGNSLLELAAETGIAGGLLCAALLAAALVAAARTAFAAGGAEGWVGKGALDALIATVVVAMLGSNFQEAAPALVVFVAIGLAFPATTTAGRGRRRAAGLAGIALMLALAVGGGMALAGRLDAARATFAGQALIASGNAAAALRALDGPAADASPEHLPHAILGNAALRVGRHDQAVAHFSAVLDRSPWFIAAFVGRAAAWEALGRYDKAEEDLRGALAVWPESPSTMLALGLLGSRRGRLDQARSDLRRAAELDPSQAEPWIAIGEIEARLGRHEEAIEAFRTAAAKNPRHPRVNLMIGDALEEKGLLELAVGFFQKASAIDPTAVEPRLRTANTLHALGRDCEARDAIQAAHDLETDPTRRETLIGVIDRLEPACRAERERTGR